ncbi:MAG TPA: CHAD domain-containing protein [Gemmataceae bacterium]|jgi:CHAD domain-containing protein
MSDAQPHADGKWVDGLSAETPVGKAARVSLAARFGAVCAALKPAADWGPDPEPVHDLRVASRRATAVLDAFADLLPRRVCKKARKALKRLRRAAGAARDADVFLDGIRGWSVHQSPADRPGLHFLLGHAFARRQVAQAGLAAAVDKARPDLAEELDGLERKLRDGKKGLLGERAAAALPEAVHELAEAVAGDLYDYEQLHRVRILAKRLRYALELFIDCYPPAVRERVYPRVEAVQDVLGLANDSYQAAKALDALLDAVRRTQPGLWDLVRGGIEELRSHHHQRLRDQRAAFTDWWRQWQALRPEALFAAVVTRANSAPSVAAGTRSPAMP